MPVQDPLHISEREVAKGLLGSGSGSGSESSLPRCSCSCCASLLGDAARRARAFHAHVFPRTLPQILARQVASGFRARASSAWATCRAAVARPWLAASVSTAAVAAALLLSWPRASLIDPAAPQAIDAPHALAPIEAPALLPKSAPDSGHAADPPRLLLRRGATISPLLDGAEVSPGDALAFVVPPGRGRHALVVSIDGAGRLSVYSPFEGERSAPIPTSVLPVALEPSITLDATLGPERLWLFLSDEPLAVADLRPALQRLAAAGPAAMRAATATTPLAERALLVDATTWLLVKTAGSRR